MRATARLCLLLFFLSACALVARSALADAIDAPPIDCARGLLGRSSHGGPFCALDACGAGDVCREGRECVTRSFCIAARTGHARGGVFVDETATLECATDADCGGAGRCRASRVCLDVVAHRRRGLVMVGVGLVLFVGMAALAVLSARTRRRR